MILLEALPVTYIEEPVGSSRWGFPAPASISPTTYMTACLEAAPLLCFFCIHAIV